MVDKIQIYSDQRRGRLALQEYIRDTDVFMEQIT